MNYFFGKVDESVHTIILEHEEAHHCAVVLRLKSGDTIGVLTQNGNVYHAELISVHKKQCTAKIISLKKYPEAKIKRHLVVAPPKNNDRLEWLVEKATELQVSSILFVKSERCIRKSINMNRLQEIVKAAMKQSINPFYTHLLEFKNLNDFLHTTFSPNSKYLLFHCEESPDKPTLTLSWLENIKDANVSDVYALIGPEGDWSMQEIQNIKSFLTTNVYELSLGEYRLRTETAAVAIASMLLLLRN